MSKSHDNTSNDEVEGPAQPLTAAGPDSELCLDEEGFLKLLEADDEPSAIRDALSLSESEIELFLKAHPNLNAFEREAVLELLSAPGGPKEAVLELLSAPAGPPGQTIANRYVLLEHIESNALTESFRAYDKNLGREVRLVSFAKKPWCGEARVTSAARRMASISHPNVALVLDTGVENGKPYVVLDVKGISLREWRRERNPSWREWVHVYMLAGRGLAALHAAGVIYLDFKPSSCVIDDEQNVQVMNSGLLQIAGVDHEDARSIGTPAYISPELYSGSSDVDWRSDQYSFCAVLYEAVYGEPHIVDWPRAWKHIIRTPKWTRGPARLRAAILRGLDESPDHRWPSMTTLVAELNRILRPRSERAVAAIGTSALAGLSGILGVAIGLGLTPLSVPDTPFGRPSVPDEELMCDAPTRKLTGIWDERVKHEVRAARRAHQGVQEPDPWLIVERKLDEYSEGWLVKYVQMCEADIPATDRALRIVCLENRRRQLKLVVIALKGGDAMDAARPELLDLPSPTQDCDHPSTLRSRL